MCRPYIYELDGAATNITKKPSSGGFFLFLSVTCDTMKQKEGEHENI